MKAIARKPSAMLTTEDTRMNLRAMLGCGAEDHFLVRLPLFRTAKLVDPKVNEAVASAA